jgi:hypothetical protein
MWQRVIQRKEPREKTDKEDTIKLLATMRGYGLFVGKTVEFHEKELFAVV